MVFFSCDGCAEMLKKNQVDGHAIRCRRCVSVSCVDCSVSFFGDDYRSHTSCISEVERYEKRTPKKNGKVPPQQLWMDLIESSIPTALAHLQSHIRAMSTLDNVPRKEKPFYNFTSNSLNLKGKHGNGIVAEIWKHLCDCRRMKQESAKDSQQQQQQQNTEEVCESTKTEREDVDKSVTNVNELHEVKVDTALLSEEEIMSNNKETRKIVDKKVVRKTMKQAFKTANSNSLTLKTLRKLVQTQFNKDDRMMVRNIITKTIDQGKHFSQDGKTVTVVIQQQGLV